MLKTPRWWPAEPAALLGIVLLSMILVRACVDALPAGPEERANRRLQDASEPLVVR